MEARIVKSNLDLLFGKDVNVSDGSPVDADNQITAVYKNNDDTACAAIVFDMPMACYSGAALSMLPAGAAEDCISSKNISGSIMENLNEVFNVVVGFFSDGRTPDIRLQSVYTSKGEISDDVNEIMKSPLSLSVQVDIPGYGVGHASMFKN